MMECYQAFILIAAHFCIVSTNVLYVVPDNSTNDVRCPSQPCVTLSQYLLDNGTLCCSNLQICLVPHTATTNL